MSEPHVAFGEHCAQEEKSGLLFDPNKADIGKRVDAASALVRRLSRGAPDAAIGEGLTLVAQSLRRDTAALAGQTPLTAPELVDMAMRFHHAADLLTVLADDADVDATLGGGLMFLAGAIEAEAAALAGLVPVPGKA
jgi:hypothetical protein